VSEGGARLLGIRYADRADVLPIADYADLGVMPNPATELLSTGPQTATVSA
jgi:hypothetical protein